MKNVVALILVFVILSMPITSLAYISTVPPPTSGGGFQFLCGDLTSCAIVIGIQVFLTLFGDKLKCLFGSEEDIFEAGLNPEDLIDDSAYDNLLGVNSLTDTTGPFGGRILIKEKCKCGAKLGVKDVMMIGPPRGTMVAVTYSTKVYNYKSFNLGNWVLGRSTGEVVCRIPKALRISFIGTSR